MTWKAPGKRRRKGMSLIELFRMFPNDAAAEQWFIRCRWGDEIACVRCGSCNVNARAAHKTMPHRCRDCDKRFSVKFGTVMEASKLGYQTWVIAMYLMSTSVKGISSIKLSEDLGIGQKAAWFLAHRIREAFAAGPDWIKLCGEVEVDETYVGGLEGNKRREDRLWVGGGTQGKTTVVGARERSGRVFACPLGWWRGASLAGFVRDVVEPGSIVFTDENPAYRLLGKGGVYRHYTVKHSDGEYANGAAHTNGIESFWALFKRGYRGVHHWMSVPHLGRYVDEFTGRYNMRSLDVIEQMERMAQGMEGKRLRYADLIAKAA